MKREFNARTQKEDEMVFVVSVLTLGVLLGVIVAFAVVSTSPVCSQKRHSQAIPYTQEKDIRWTMKPASP